MLVIIKLVYTLQQTDFLIGKKWGLMKMLFRTGLRSVNNKDNFAQLNPINF